MVKEPLNFTIVSDKDLNEIFNMIREYTQNEIVSPHQSMTRRNTASGTSEKAIPEGRVKQSEEDYA